jgi:hypothetical protein
VFISRNGLTLPKNHERVSTKGKQGKINTLIGGLSSEDEGKALAALKALEANGDPLILPVLVDLLKRDDLSVKLRQEVLEFLNGLKDTSAIPVLMDLLRNEDNLSVRPELLTVIWSTKLDFSAYLSDFVSIATDGDFMEALECITVIENLEGPFSEQQILESQLHLKEYLEDDAPKNPQVAHIMSEIAVLIKEINELDDDGLSEFM